ncbi:MAG: HAD family hydrolase [Actinomycetota bacterium]
MRIRSSFPFEAVLWDMDGTLIDSEPIWIEEETLLMRSLGIEWSNEDALHCLGGPLERVDAYMRSRSGNQHQPLELAYELIDRMITRLSGGVDFTTGSNSLLDEMHLEQIPMALVSASTRKIMDAALDDSKTGMQAAIGSGAFVLGLPHLTDLPMGEKVVHREGLAELDLESLGLLFQGVFSR